MQCFVREIAPSSYLSRMRPLTVRHLDLELQTSICGWFGGISARCRQDKIV